jgi:acylphosphatase
MSRHGLATRGTTVAEERQARRFYISGRVQGVGYRYFAQRVAAKLGLSGYVKNLDDGRVEAYAVGATDQLQAFQTQLRRGPSYALVEAVDELDTEIESRWSQDFSIEDD